MTKEEFYAAWNNNELDLDYSQFQYDNYPDPVTFEDFEDFMVD